MSVPRDLLNTPRRYKREDVGGDCEKDVTFALHLGSGTWDLGACGSWNQYSMLMRFDSRWSNGESVILRERDYRRAGSRTGHTIQQQNNFPISGTTKGAGITGTKAIGQTGGRARSTDFCTATLLLDRTGGLRQTEPCAR